MQKNPELLRKAMDRILENPEDHDQTAWIARKYDEEGGACGTTMCLAGHVAVEAGAEAPKWFDPNWDGDWYLDDNGKFREYYERYNEDGDDIVEVSVFARNKLGLSWEEREYLFYHFGDTESLHGRVKNVLEAWENGEAYVPTYDEDGD